MGIQEVNLLPVHGDQLNMAVFLWYLWKSDFSSVHMYFDVRCRQVFLYKIPELYDHV